MSRRLLALLTVPCALIFAPRAHAQSPAPLPSSARLLDGFETTAGWSAHPSDGVSLSISSDSSGTHGHAMRLDFDFHGHGGYAIARKKFDIALPENYALSYRIRGDAPPENFEVKLIDSTGDNVWWNNAVNVHFPKEWTPVTLKKRHITFAWGPRGGGELGTLAALELSITAGSGGKGTVWIDGLTFTPLEPIRPYTGTPVASASSEVEDHAPALASDGKESTWWRSEPTSGAQTFTLDFGTTREYGGATIDWAPGAAARDYVVETSTDGSSWDSAYTVQSGNGGRDWIYAPETESRYLRVRIPASSEPRAYAIRELAAIPVEWSESRNDFFAHVAASAPAGSYPKYLSAKQSYWTVVGVDGDDAEALINEQGAIEPHAGGFSLEPFLRVGKKLVTWHDARQTQSLAKGYLPIPSVTWTAGALKLEVTTFAAGAPDSSSLFARYRITNRGKTAAKPTLYLAVRPFQVNPSWQFLATQGGEARIKSIAWDDTLLRVNDMWNVVPLTAPAAVGASTFDEGGINEALRADSLPTRHDVRDAMEHSSAAMSFRLSIPVGKSRDVYVLMPLHQYAPISRPFTREGEAAAFANRVLKTTTRAWDSTVNRVQISLPRSAARVTETLRAQLAYILTNDHGAQIHPGSRSYARSWIRDGSMIGAALLRLGHPEQVRAFLEWYAPYQFPTGKVPCCVDARGADPVPENDSHGELVYAIADYFRYTGDTAFLRQMWPHITGAVSYMDSLRAQRLTDEYSPGRAPPNPGLIPQSNTHQRNSPKPMQS